MSRRQLGQMRAELGSGLQPALARASMLQVRRLAVELPVEFALRRQGDSLQLLGDMPQRVTRTDFDTRPSRLVVVWELRP